MKHIWLKNDDTSELLIFCNGWGMDAVPFSTLENSAGMDVLMLYDYTIPELELDLQAIAGEYKTTSLAAWSLGVWAAAELFQRQKVSFASAVAIAGTLEPASDDCGIPVDVFEASMRHWNTETRKKFERRMCKVPEARKHFVSPGRLPSEQCAELLALRARLEDSPINHHLFTRAVICEKDHIFPYEAQVAAWSKCNVKIIEKPWPHYPFYNFKAWRDIVNL